MRNHVFRLPDIGEGIVEAEIVAWHVSVGDRIDEDCPLADLMTDKATVEMTSPVAGRIVELAGDVGDMVAIGAMLARFEVAQDEAGPEGDAIPLRAVSDEAVRPPQQTKQHGVAQDQGVSGKAPKAVESHSSTNLSGRQRILASPAVRRRAETLQISLADVVPAADGRVRHADLDAFLAYEPGKGYNRAQGGRPDEQIKVVGLRRRIADNMSASKRSIPHFSYVEEIDMTKLEALRFDLNATRGEKPRLTILPLMITAIAKALPDFPMMNARFDDEAGIVTRFGALHLGLATQTDAGLMVPVVRDAQTLNIWQLAREIARLAEAARNGTARTEDLSGSTLTITSLGPLGGLATTPIVNRPEVAIIGPNKLVERPVWRDGAISSAIMMNLSMSCDHRVIDGWDAARFVQELKRLLETPSLLLI